ncbi:Uma2 family endonuclease [Stieleria maiorica]|uniref:Uma2 family endonuclease n=1 Tax=Stieleria maiorica TaxID=2795974 RepID=UPI0021BC8560|nr:Uma2 family endonuclease [Stieleria maiorica]
MPEYLQIDIAGNTVTVHRDPEQQRYRSIQTYEQSDTIGPLYLPGAQLAIASLFTTDP